MKIRSLAKGLEYRGEVSGKKQTYHVFESGKTFVVMSEARTKPDSGYFNLVSAAAVDHVRRSFAGRQDVTARGLVSRSRKPRYVKNPLQALNILYVLVATGQATRDDRFKDRSLHFNIHPR
jgi:hypothetical protein